MGDQNIEKRRARWRRNKRTARAEAVRTARPLPPGLLTAVLAERDRRASDTRITMRWRWPSFIKSEAAEKAVAFVADVWAAKTLLEWQHGEGSGKPTRIARWLADNEATHGYADSSLRVMAYRALDRLKIAESDDGLAMDDEPWPKFDFSVWGEES